VNKTDPGEERKEFVCFFFRREKKKTHGRRKEGRIKKKQGKKKKGWANRKVLGLGLCNNERKKKGVILGGPLTNLEVTGDHPVWGGGRGGNKSDRDTNQVKDGIWVRNGRGLVNGGGL